MRIRLVTPAAHHTQHGNRITALRWARFLRELGHRVAVRQRYEGEPCDLLIALHARRSFDAVARYRRAYPDGPMIVALTGTDLYRDLHRGGRACRSLEWATRIVVLQPRALASLPEGLRHKARVIYQSAKVRHAPAEGARGVSGRQDRIEGFPRRTRIAPGTFEVCVLGHLRPVKDPFRTALAARLLPASSRIRVLHVGAALGGAMARRAQREMARNLRYLWLGERRRSEALRILAHSRLLVLTSTMEGGANVVSEALAANVPVISSRIDGSIGLLGASYPGYFPVGDERALAQLLHRAETDRWFYARLMSWCARLGPRFDPEREKSSWKSLLREISPGETGHRRRSKALRARASPSPTRPRSNLTSSAT